MQPGEGEIERTRAAEHAFAEFLARGRSDDALEFEAFCKHRAEIAGELRRLHADWRRVAPLLERASGGDVPATDDDASAEAVSAQETRVRLDASATSALFGERLAPWDELHTRYRMRSELARGGMGIVLEVWDQALRRSLAMKVALSPAIDEPRSLVHERVLSRFLDEAQITAQLEHPGIVPVHDLGRDSEGRVYFTMPLVRGREFKEIILLARGRREGWTLTRALGVILRVCEAMAFAHSKGVVHRDLKPGNIMIGRFGETYVMDWGLARVIVRHPGGPGDEGPGGEIIGEREAGPATVASPGEPAGRPASAAPMAPVTPVTNVETGQSAPHRTRHGDVVGTPAYMSPEQAQGKVEEIDERSDVYSIGAILYHLLTGEIPYITRAMRLNPELVLGAQLQGPPPPVLQLDPDAPPELAAICAKAMARERSLRYASSLDLARDIEAFLDRRPVAAHEPSLSHVARLFYERHRRSVLAVAAALLVFTALAAWLNSKRNDALAQTRIALAEKSRLADVMSARALLSQSEELFTTPLRERAAALQSWLGRVGDLLARAGHYRGELQAAEGSVQATPDADLSRMLSQIEELEARLPRVRAHLAELEALDDPEFAEEWKRARERGLELEDQLGLVPLQQDPGTGLWEFWCPLSGEKPLVADLATGELADEPRSAIVLALLPGGSFEMGSPEDEPGREGNETLHSETVAPFFVGRLEVTQAQWQRVMGSNPAIYADGPLHPVESVSWFDCVEFAHRLGLGLPSETQWEYAARGETSTAYCYGDDPALLEGKENVFDLSLFGPAYGEPAPWNDGHPYHAPVGFSPPNPFGLHDLHGNVEEWCSDVHSGEETSQREARRNLRGGSYVLAPKHCRSAFRQWNNPKSPNQAIGLRVAREVDE